MSDTENNSGDGTVRQGVGAVVRPILPNTPDTLLSARRANQVIDLFNALDRIRAVPPLYVYVSDANIVFEYQEPQGISKEPDNGANTKS